MCFLSVCVSSLEKCLFHFHPLFYFILFFCIELNELFVYVGVSFANISSHSEGCLFIFFMASFVV